MKSSNLTNWEKETNELAQYFEKRYFGKVDCDSYWIGGVYIIGDYFFDITSIAGYIREQCSTDLMFEHYNYTLEERIENKAPVNIKNYKKWKR